MGTRYHTSAGDGRQTPCAKLTRRLTAAPAAAPTLRCAGVVRCQSLQHLHPCCACASLGRPAPASQALPSTPARPGLFSKEPCGRPAAPAVARTACMHRVRLAGRTVPSAAAQAAGPAAAARRSTAACALSSVHSSRSAACSSPCFISASRSCISPIASTPCRPWPCPSEGPVSPRGASAALYSRAWPTQCQAPQGEARSALRLAADRLGQVAPGPAAGRPPACASTR